MTGDLADAVHRDLLADRLTLDDLSWRDLWCYVTAAQPGTAIHHARNDGWVVGDHIAAEQLSDIRELLWRYTALHFEGGKNLPFPERVVHPGAEPAAPGKTWATVSLDEMISPEVRDLLKGE